MNEELIKMVLEECQRRCAWHEKQYRAAINGENKAANSEAYIAYSSAGAMLEYALAGNSECLKLFMTEEEPE